MDTHTNTTQHSQQTLNTHMWPAYHTHKVTTLPTLHSRLHSHHLKPPHTAKTLLNNYLHLHLHCSSITLNTTTSNKQHHHSTPVSLNTPGVSKCPWENSTLTPPHNTQTTPPNNFTNCSILELKPHMHSTAASSLHTTVMQHTYNTDTHSTTSKSMPGLTPSSLNHTYHNNTLTQLDSLLQSHNNNSQWTLATHYTRTPSTSTWLQHNTTRSYSNITHKKLQLPLRY